MRLILAFLTLLMVQLSSAQAGDRFPLLTPEQLTPEGKLVSDTDFAESPTDRDPRQRPNSFSIS